MVDGSLCYFEVALCRPNFCYKMPFFFRVKGLAIRLRIGFLSTTMMEMFV